MKNAFYLLLAFATLAVGYSATVEQASLQDSLQSSLSEIKRDTSESARIQAVTEETKFFGDYTILENEVVNKKIRVIGGDLFVHGTIIGQIIVVGGDVYLKPTANVQGKVLTLGGTIYKDPGAIISGNTFESNLEGGLIYREVEENVTARDKRFNLKNLSDYNSESWLHPKMSLFQYNRQEGVVFNIEHPWEMGFRSRVLFNLGYRSDAEEKIVGRLTIERHFFENQNFTLFMSLYNQAKTDDGFRLPVDENSLAALLGRQDFYDRWNEKGWEYGAGFNFTRFKFKASYGQADHDSLEVQNIKSLFEKDRALRPDVPDFEKRKVETLNLTVAFRTDNYHPLSSGLALLFNKELFKESGAGDPVYKMGDGVIDRTTATAILILSPGPGLVIRTRVMAGISNNELYSHRKFYVGGLGSVSAHPFKEQGGNMMALGNVEFFLRPSEHKHSDMYIKFFVDGGHAWDKADYGFGELSDHLDNAISSYGVGLGDADHSGLDFGINIAFPSDNSKKSETTIRINYTF